MANEENVDLVDIVREMAIRKLVEICGNEKPEEYGLFQEGGKLVFGKFSSVEETNLSLEEILDEVANRGLEGTGYEKLHLVFWVEETDPFAFEWTILTSEQLSEMLDSTRH